MYSRSHAHYIGLWAILGLSLALRASSAQTIPPDSFFTLKSVKPGIIVAMATSSHMENANATIIFLDSSVMVVDAQQRPSAAASLIRQIKALTPFPVTYLVDTHFHDDHVQGNRLYKDAWPGVQIIASEETRESLRDRGIPQLRNQLATLPSTIESMRRRLTGQPNAVRRSALEDSLEKAQQYLNELRAVRIELPTMTVAQRLTIHTPHRAVELRCVGRAHTDGDVVVYLPDDKVLITGDVVDALEPWMGDSHPYEWIKVLDEMKSVDAEYMIGGHGDVMHGKAQIDLWRNYLHDLLAQTAEVFANGASLIEARRLVARPLLATYGKRFSPAFVDEIGGHIEKAYRVISGVTD
jgi:cyclase